MKRKIFFGLSSIFLLVLFNLFITPGSQVMGSELEDCQYFTDDFDTNSPTYTVNLVNIPNDLNTSAIIIGYDETQLTYDNCEFSGCLTETHATKGCQPAGVGRLYVFAIGNVPEDSSGCFCKINFTIVGQATSPWIEVIADDFCPNGQCWCSIPMACHVEIISPYNTTPYSEDTIDFTAGNFYCAGEPSYVWSTDGCGSEIEILDTSSARYTAGIVDSSCTDMVTVTDTGNEHEREEYSKAAATLFINPSVLINPEKPKPADYPTVGSGSSVKFEADTPFCDGTTNNTWSVESSIGSEINHVTGQYQAGREFTSCDDAEDIIKVNAVCLDDGVERIAEENVTIPACKMTISPSSITVASGGTVTFFNSLDACCTKPPEPEYSWELQSAIGSTITDNPPNERFLYRAGNNTGSQDFGETITVTDSNHLDVTDKVIVTILPLQAPCVSDEDCDDQNTCTDDRCVDEQCVYECNATGPNDECCVDPACEGTTICSGCTGDDDCNNLDRDYCDGNVVKHDEGKCVENLCEAETTIVESCDDDGVYCNGDEICEDGSCRHSGDPCPEETTCDEENNVCTTTIPPPSIITASPDPLMRSRWVILPTLVIITGEDTSFSQLTSRVSYSPSTALLPLPALVLGPEIIWQLVFVNPSWLAGFPGDPQTVTATVDDGSYDFEIQLLPFILDQK